MNVDRQSETSFPPPLPEVEHTPDITIDEEHHHIVLTQEALQKHNAMQDSLRQMPASLPSQEHTELLDMKSQPTRESSGGYTKISGDLFYPCRSRKSGHSAQSDDCVFVPFRETSMPWSPFTHTQGDYK